MTQFHDDKTPNTAQSTTDSEHALAMELHARIRDMAHAPAPEAAKHTATELLDYVIGQFTPGYVIGGRRITK